MENDRRPHAILAVVALAVAGGLEAVVGDRQDHRVVEQPLVLEVHHQFIDGAIKHIDEAIVIFVAVQVLLVGRPTLRREIGDDGVKAGRGLGAGGKLIALNGAVAVLVEHRVVLAIGTVLPPG